MEGRTQWEKNMGLGDSSEELDEAMGLNDPDDGLSEPEIDAKDLGEEMIDPDVSPFDSSDVPVFYPDLFDKGEGSDLTLGEDLHHDEDWDSFADGG